MKKFNPEYDIPKLRGILTAVLVIMAIIIIAFHWTEAYFVFVVLLGVISLLDTIREKMENHRFNAIVGLCASVFFFVFAVYSFLKYNM